jgi:hypothetical protein
VLGRAGSGDRYSLGYSAPSAPGPGTALALRAETSAARSLERATLTRHPTKLVSVTVYSDNPAGRLYELLTSFRLKAGQHSVPTAWAAALDISNVNDPELLRRLAYVFRLPDEIQAELALVDEQEYDDLAVRWLATIPGQLGPSLFSGRQSNQLSSEIDDASLASLEHCNWILHRYRPQRVFSNPDLDRIRGLISELLDEIRNDGGLEQDLRNFLTYHALAMLNALRDLRIRGPVALEDAFDQARGAVYRRMDLTVHMDSHSGVWTKFQNVIVAVAAVLQIATSSFVLPGQIRQELEGPPPPQAPVVKVIEKPVDAHGGPVPDVQQHGKKVTESHASG